VPFIGYPEEGAGVLRAHVARANPQWRELPSATECLVVFQGPQAYISPTLYPTKAETHKVVPTWNYATVHVWGRARAIEDAGWLRRQIDDLTLAREGSRPNPWKVADAPADFIAAQLKAIVGIEIAITRIEAKWKMSQNRNEADRQGVADGLRAEGGAQQAEVARLVAERGKPA
jgi:transcriptional regulator